MSVWLCKYLYLESIISCLHVFANISPKLPKNFTLKKIQGVFTPLPRQLHPPKTNMTMEKTKAFEDASGIKNGAFPLSCC